MINWKASKKDVDLIQKITDRAMGIAKAQGVKYKRQDAEMDIAAVHCNGNPLRLEELLAADEFNFSHDIFGIRRHINRETGKLNNHFLPRFTKTKE